MEAEDSASGNRFIQACDTCRVRKIRCDRKTPCSSCSTAQISCLTTKRVQEKKKRILISSSYEKEVRGVNERLASLEKTINTLVVAPRVRDSSERPLVTQPFATSSGLAEVSNDPTTSFEGASSFATYSKETSQAFQLAAKAIQYPIDSPSPSEGSTVTPIAMLKDVESPVIYSSNPRAILTLVSRELPPMGLTLKLLRFAKDFPLKIFSDFPSLRLESISTLCQKIYFPTEDYTQCQFALFNSVIYFCWSDIDQHVIREQSFNETEISLSISICKGNMEDLTRTMSLVMDDHSFEAIQAVALMSCYFLDTSRPSLSRKFVSAAARLCQDAGYHCLQRDSDVPDLDLKILTFWHIFSLDRGLSLNFGRSPTIQDYDISCPKPEADLSGDFISIIGYISVELAFIQGEIFAKLYSARAQLESPEQKTALARSLGARLESARQMWLLSYNSFTARSGTSDVLDGIDLTILSNLSLIYRVIPSKQVTSGQSNINSLVFCEECITTSRTALEAYNSTWEKYQQRDGNGWKSLINWTYLFSPFTSFLVMFGTVISFRSEEDMRLLERSVKVLKSAAKFSQGVLNLFNTCDKFYQIAKQYMSQPLHGQRHPQNDTFDHQMPDMADAIEWDALFNEWDLGINGRNAREVSGFLNDLPWNSSFTWPDSLD